MEGPQEMKRLQELGLLNLRRKEGLTSWLQDIEKMGPDFGVWQYYERQHM